MKTAKVGFSNSIQNSMEAEIVTGIAARKAIDFRKEQRAALMRCCVLVKEICQEMKHSKIFPSKAFFRENGPRDFDVLLMVSEDEYLSDRILPLFSYLMRQTDAYSKNENLLMEIDFIDDFAADDEFLEEQGYGTYINLG